MEPLIRPEKGSDFLRIKEINDLAFGQEKESELIDRLRRTERFIHELSLVAEWERTVVGHILFYPVHIRSQRATHVSLALAPMCVHPDFQNRGIGSALVEKGLSKAKELGYDSVIVVGHPDYYPRFGFTRASRWNITAPFEVPDDVFLALELKQNSLENVCGTVEYPEEFNAV